MGRLRINFQYCYHQVAFLLVLHLEAYKAGPRDHPYQGYPLASFLVLQVLLAFLPTCLDLAVCNFDCFMEEVCLNSDLILALMEVATILLHPFRLHHRCSQQVFS